MKKIVAAKQPKAAAQVTPQLRAKVELWGSSYKQVGHPACN